MMELLRASLSDPEVQVTEIGALLKLPFSLSKMIHLLVAVLRELLEFSGSNRPCYYGSLNARWMVLN